MTDTNGLRYLKTPSKGYTDANQFNIYKFKQTTSEIECLDYCSATEICNSMTVTSGGKGTTDEPYYFKCTLKSKKLNQHVSLKDDDGQSVYHKILCKEECVAMSDPA